MVNQEAIHAQIQNRTDYSNECQKWSDYGYFIDQIGRCIEEKQRKCSNLFVKGCDVELLFHSDEMWLEASLQYHLENELKFDKHNFKRIWLMLSYCPFTYSYPVISLF